MVREAPQPLPEGVPHYYGDVVRQTFIVAAAIMLIGAPFYTDSLRVQLPFIIAGALALVAIAALVNPHKQSTFMAGAVVSGVGLVIYEVWALYGYPDSNPIQFILREVLAILFMIGFYFSMKTIRAFMLHSIGRHAEPGEFEDEPLPAASTSSTDQSTGQDDFLPWSMQKGKTRDTRNTSQADTPVRQSPGRSKKELYPQENPYEEIL